jgi:UDP-N-acetylglucosamine transferase subunit ALG13
MADSACKVVGSVGTDHHPFPRFLQWMAAAQREIGFDLLVQRGATPEQAGVTSVDFMAAAELEAEMASADVVVCHGGPGTMSLAQRCGHRPIVIARDPSLGEHVDDHQQRYTAKLRSANAVDAPSSVEELIELIRSARGRGTVSTGMDNEIAVAVDRFGELVQGLVAGTIEPRPLRERMLFRRTP